MSGGQGWKNILRVFVSSTFGDLKGERRILDKVESALTSVGIANFIPDGRT